MDDFGRIESGGSALEDRTEQVRLAQIQRALSNSTGNMVRVMGGACFVTYVLYGRTPMRYLIAWNLILLTLILCTSLYMRHHPIQTLTPVDARRVSLVRMGFGTLISSTWGLLAFIPTSTDTLLYRTFLFVALSALGAVGGIGFSVILPYVYVLNLTCLGPMIFWFFLDGREFSFLMGCGGLVWMALILKTSHQIGRSQVAEIDLREKLKEEMQKLDEARKQVARLANHDDLTGLANRRLFEETFKQFIAIAKRNRRIFGLLLIDLDNFKQVNDRLGHHIGDRLLENVAERLIICCREVDCVARMGGDEFAVLVDAMTVDSDLDQIARRIVETFRQPFMVDREEIKIGASIGIAIWPKHGGDLEQLMRSADQAMYLVKQEGKDGFRFCRAKSDKEFINP